MKRLAVLTALLCLTAQSQDFPVTLTIDASTPAAPLRPVWRYFGHDEPNYTYMKDGQKLLSELAALDPATTVYVRCHNLLTTGDGTPALKWGSTNAYTEDPQGNPIYDWTITDRIFDTYVKRGLKPYAQIGFMPKALSTHPDPYQHDFQPGKRNNLFTGWAFPPKDYARWGELVHQWVKHCLDRYGQKEVESWYWEVWNEPNIGYWRGTVDEYCKLYDYAADGVKRALPAARVGGSEIAGGGSPGGITFQRAFFDHCLRGTNYATGQRGSPLDFLSFHAKGAPRVVNGHVQMGIAHQLNDIDKAFALIASYPELKHKPIVIGESDPDGCAACPATLYPQNAYRNSTLYAAYTAATFARALDLADRHGVNFEGALTWAFEFENQPYFAGFRVLATNGIDLPVLNTFRMMAQLKGRRLPVTSTVDPGLNRLLEDGVRGPARDVYAIATLSDRKLAVMTWNYHDDDVRGGEAWVDLDLNGLPARVRRATLRHYRIDINHSNSFEAWKRMGSPASPTPRQYETLQAAGNLQEFTPAQPTPIEDGSARVRLNLPRQSVSLLVLNW
jgi:xylan 1,4-beta-xylosidase